MKRFTFSEFTEQYLKDGIDIAPWQKEMIASLGRGTFAFRSFPFVDRDLHFKRKSGKTDMVNSSPPGTLMMSFRYGENTNALDGHGDTLLEGSSRDIKRTVAVES